MKFRSGIHLFLPILLLLMVALLAATVACSQDDGNTSLPSTIAAPAPTEAPTPLTAAERAAIGDFETQLQAIDDEWEEFYTDLDDWRAGLVECHPSAAQESLGELAAAYISVVETARDLPRTANTKALANLVIAASEAEETAFRHLRDRWQAGNISLFEMVEQGRVNSSLTQNSVTDMSLELRGQFEQGPSFDDVAEMEDFSDTFDAIADDWDDFHDSYAAFAKRESKLEEEVRSAEYERLVELLSGIANQIDTLKITDTNEDFVDELQEAAEDEMAALQFLADFPPDLSSESTAEADSSDADSSDTEATSATAPSAAVAPAPEVAAAPAAVPAEDPAEQTPTAPAEPTATTQASPVQPVAEEEEEATPESPIEELVAAISETEALHETLEQSIDEIVNDTSAESLEDLGEFDVQLELFTGQWDQFYEDYNEWRAADGGCDRVEVGKVLSGYSQQAGELAELVDDLPQSGFLLSVYTLTVEAAERESGAIRTLANSWTPFAVDAFKAADDERVNSARLRRQAAIALEELSNRP